MDVVCPQCTTQFSADPGRLVSCPQCGYTGGQVPGMADVQTYQPEEKFLPDDVDPSADDDEDDDWDDDGEREQPKETSRVALTALIIGLSSVLIPLGGPVAVGFGIGGIVQVKRHPETMKGTGLAVIGIVFGVLTSIAWFIFLVSIFSIGGRLVTGQ